MVWEGFSPKNKSYKNNEDCLSSMSDVDGAAAFEYGVDTNISSQCKNRYLIDSNFVACAFEQ